MRIRILIRTWMHRVMLKRFRAEQLHTSIFEFLIRNKTFLINIRQSNELKFDFFFEHLNFLLSCDECVHVFSSIADVSAVAARVAACACACAVIAVIAHAHASVDCGVERCARCIRNVDRRVVHCVCICVDRVDVECVGIA
jgi:hypothetical protein